MPDPVLITVQYASEDDLTSLDLEIFIVLAEQLRNQFAVLASIPRQLAGQMSYRTRGSIVAHGCMSLDRIELYLLTWTVELRSVGTLVGSNRFLDDVVSRGDFDNHDDAAAYMELVLAAVVGGYLYFWL